MVTKGLPVTTDLYPVELDWKVGFIMQKGRYRGGLTYLNWLGRGMCRGGCRGAAVVCPLLAGLLRTTICKMKHIFITFNIIILMNTFISKKETFCHDH